MYLSVLKYTGILLFAASTARAEIVVVPPVFEDFPGTTTVGLISSNGTLDASSRWRFDILLRAGELGPGPMTIHQIGVRLKRQTGAPPVLRGSLTLSATRADRLDERFAVNTGTSPVAFFATSHHAPATMPGADGGLVVFDLAHGFRYRPEVEGNLHVAFEVELLGDLLIDAAPASSARLLRAEGFHARRGQLLELLPIVQLGVERDRPVPATVARAPRRPTSARKRAPTHELAARVDGVQTVVASLEDRVDELVDENRKLQSLLESRADGLVWMFTQQRVEAALASGKPTLGLLQTAPVGGQLDMARSIIRELLRSWPSNPRAVHAAALAAEGDAFLEQDQADMALASYSSAYRALLSSTDPSGQRAPIITIRSELPRLRAARGLGPYDVLSGDLAPPPVLSLRSERKSVRDDDTERAPD